MLDTRHVDLKAFKSTFGELPHAFDRVYKSQWDDLDVQPVKPGSPREV